MEKWQRILLRKDEQSFSGGIVSQVEEGSLAHQLGILPGDEIREVNGRALQDIIDFKILTDEDEFSLRLKRRGKFKTVLVKNELRKPLGVYFRSSIFDGLKVCQNRCIFCFVDQLPPGLRKSLYLKDDDYRLSFLYGNFVTLTNVEDSDIERIISQNISPLYLSFHSINPEIRKLMMGRNHSKIYGYLKNFSEGSVDIHIQIVLCPGINDDKELEATLSELKSKYSCVKSVGIVPVGLTSYRTGLFPLRLFTKEEIKALIKQIDSWQKKCRRERGISWVYLADEFYLNAGVSVPEGKDYDNFPQLENGIGLTRKLLDNIEKLRENLDLSRIKKEFFAVTGKLISRVIEHSFDKIGVGNKIKVCAVTNKFFGSQVTVSGLLTGSELLSLQDKMKGILLISETLLNEEKIFLDNISFDELQQRLRIPVKLVAQDGSNLAQILTEGI